MQHGVQPDFVSTQMLASVRMAEWELTHKLELLTEVHRYQVCRRWTHMRLDNQNIAVHAWSEMVASLFKCSRSCVNKVP